MSGRIGIEAAPYPQRYTHALIASISAMQSEAIKFAKEHSLPARLILELEGSHERMHAARVRLMDSLDARHGGKEHAVDVCRRTGRVQNQTPPPSRQQAQEQVLPIEGIPER